MAADVSDHSQIATTCSALSPTEGRGYRLRCGDRFSIGFALGDGAPIGVARLRPGLSFPRPYDGNDSVNGNTSNGRFTGTISYLYVASRDR